MGLTLLLALASASLAQDPFLIAVVRGELLEWEGTAQSGEVVFRGPKSRVYRCRFDDRTLFENSRMRITPASLKSKDPVEVVTDFVRWEGKCYARTVRVTEPHKPPRGRLQPYRLATEHIAPRGSLTYGGIVVKVTPEILILRTRSEGRLSLHLREDTRFMHAGLPSDASKLTANTRVFVRAGKSYDDTIEVYQVSWGEILTTR